MFTQAAEVATDLKRPLVFIKDSVITAKIKARLATKKLSSLAHVQVETDARGAVTLGGTTSSRKEAERAVRIARETSGVTSVKDKIRITKGE